MSRPEAHRLRWGLISVGAIGFALISVFVALVLLPARADFQLTTVSGSLARCGSEFCLDDNPINFGPDWYLQQTPSTVDYNGDGQLGSLYEELNGLVGNQALAEVAADGESSDVYVFNGSPWRGIEQSAPWTTDPPQQDDQSGSTVSLPSGTVIGVLERCGSDWCVGRHSLYFGPWWYLSHGTAAEDFDGDGSVGTPMTELDGLLDVEVAIEGLVEDGQFHVLTINGLNWRPAAGPPPWAGGPTPGSISPSGPDEDQGGGATPPEEPEQAPPGTSGPPSTLPAPAGPERPPGPPPGVPGG